MAVELDDWCRVEVIYLLHLVLHTHIHRRSIVVIASCSVVAGFVFVHCIVRCYEPRNEQWTYQTHKYLTLSHTVFTGVSIACYAEPSIS